MLCVIQIRNSLYIQYTVITCIVQRHLSHDQTKYLMPDLYLLVTEGTFHTTVPRGCDVKIHCYGQQMRQPAATYCSGYRLQPAALCGKDQASQQSSQFDVVIKSICGNPYSSLLPHCFPPITLIRFPAHKWSNINRRPACLCIQVELKLKPIDNARDTCPTWRKLLDTIIVIHTFHIN